eukprot:GHVR01028761.1.p1 GENE.GHVR01028761.1~~GHVR01028761.1.p1  ORF type:complete len:158 (+),score=51.80 GHVR01028761.1:609-1082(+)
MSVSSTAAPAYPSSQPTTILPPPFLLSIPAIDNSVVFNFIQSLIHFMLLLLSNMYPCIYGLKYPKLQGVCGVDLSAQYPPAGQIDPVGALFTALHIHKKPPPQGTVGAAKPAHFLVNSLYMNTRKISLGFHCYRHTHTHTHKQTHTHTYTGREIKWE